MEDKNNEQVPVGEWTDVRRGQVVAEGTYVDNEGYLRFASNNAYAAWHFKDCPVTKVTKEEIVIDPKTKAQWCPRCHARHLNNQDLVETSNRIESLFMQSNPEEFIAGAPKKED